MNRLSVGICVVISHFIFAQNATAQKEENLKMSPPPVVEKMEPKVVNAELKAQPPSPPPVKTPMIKLPAEHEKGRKESEEKEYRKNVPAELENDKVNN